MAESAGAIRLLLSLFCGPGGLDLGFERAGYAIGLALDSNEQSLQTYRRNRGHGARAFQADLMRPRLDTLDRLYGKPFYPTGVIGGPPCQSFSQANQMQADTDLRHTLPLAMARLVVRLNERRPISFVVLENVPDLGSHRHRWWLDPAIEALEEGGFHVSESVLNAADFGVPQNRERLFVVATNSELFDELEWAPPRPRPAPRRTVRDAIGDLPRPRFFERGIGPEDIPHHPNHWCMAPKSPKFTQKGWLKPGRSSQRSFKTLRWDEPSLTVAYGHREVHIHPSCKRRLSVFEAMRLQSFPDDYILCGTLSAQIEQVSEAVPPLLAQAVAKSIAHTLGRGVQARARGA